jgi:CubicO group peptidase (beta-lactamase class C family)
VGSYTYDGDGVVEEGTVYDVASITKAITASLALAAVADGVLALTDLVRTHIPELRNDHAATVEDLLRYRVHAGKMSALAERPAREILAQVLKEGFHMPDGTEHYSNVPAFLLGMIVERVGGAQLAVLAQRELFDPLGMRDSSFMVSRKHAAPTEIDANGIVQNIVHDESARAFAREEMSVGHAGMFSTAPDILNFLEVLLRGRYPAIVEGAQKGLGWELNKKWFMGSRFGPRTFGKTGFTGTSIVCDCDRGVALVILSNRTYPKRPADSDAINTFRQDIANCVL